MADDPRPDNDPADDVDTSPEVTRNAISESVHRYSARSLLDSTSVALDWPRPQRFPTGPYPDVELMKALGQFFRDAEPGFRSVDFQGLLAWEAIPASCQKPAGVSQDWIDRLVLAITPFDSANLANPAKLEDAVQTLRDWLLADAAIGTAVLPGAALSERGALEALFGMPLATTRASTFPGLTAKLRNVCGVMLKSPHFMLAGPTTAGLGAAPRLRVCNRAPCTYQELCSAMSPALARITGRTVTCNANAVALAPMRSIGNLRVADICRNGACSIVTVSPRTICQLFPRACSGESRIDPQIIHGRFKRAYVVEIGAAEIVKGSTFAPIITSADKSTKLVADSGQGDSQEAKAKTVPPYIEEQLLEVRPGDRLRIRAAGTKGILSFDRRKDRRLRDRIDDRLFVRIAEPLVPSDALAEPPATGERSTWTQWQSCKRSHTCVMARPDRLQIPRR